MRVNKKQENNKIQEMSISEMDGFTYLGSLVSKDGGADEDIRNRISKAR